MRKELANSGLSEEEILTKTMLLQKALAGDNSPAFVNKTIKSALEAAQLSPSELAKVKIHRLIWSLGSAVVPYKTLVVSSIAFVYEVQLHLMLTFT